MNHAMPCGAEPPEADREEVARWDRSREHFEKQRGWLVKLLRGEEQST